MTRPKRNDATIQVTKQDLMRMLSEDDAMKSLLQTLLQEVLEAEMEKHCGPAKTSARAVGSATGAAMIRGRRLPESAN